MNTTKVVDKKLSANAVQELEESIGSKLVYLIAVDIEGNQTLLPSANVSVQKGQLKEKPQEISHLHTAAFTRSTATCTYCYQSPTGQQIALLILVNLLVI